MTNEVRRLFIDDCEAFLRVGRVLYTEWAGLDADEKACMLVAQKRIDIDRALVGSHAQQGPLAELALVSEVDGGRALLRAQIESAIVRWAEKRAGAA